MFSIADLVHDTNCNFDVDFCSWTQSKTDQFDWSRTTASYQNVGTGPLGDHTGQGSYIYIDASVTYNIGDKADLVSPLISSTSSAVSHILRFLQLILLLFFHSF